MSKSRPVYTPFALDPTGTAHLVVTSLPTPPVELDDSLSEVEVWCVAHAGPGIPAFATGNNHAFRSITELFAQLEHRLARAGIGLRLYAVGSEAFIWDANNIATTVGLGRGEIFLHQAGPKLRRVYCTHCRTMIEDVAVNIVPCPVCEANLFVRDHFSCRLAAFMGVKVDAEVPGEIPAPEVFTT
ncbi:dimethylamine monooxygenase subunit DmmA family protein [Acidocella sp.]|uniref:dimethylamine monooxygenase subunit DmmA family protein n=1 Tax=Acidocella sp. TaxID=50710 RepID=UPI003D065AEC